MELLFNYQPQVKKSFCINSNPNGLIKAIQDYGLGVTPPMPEGNNQYIVNISPSLILIANNEKVVEIETYSAYVVSVLPEETLSTDFLLKLTAKATQDLKNEFDKLVANLGLSLYDIQMPDHSRLIPLIQSCIDKWDMAIRRTSLQ